MKFLLINYEFPPLGGGAGNATENIAKNLAKLGHSVVVVTTWFSGLADHERVDGYEIFRVHSRRGRIDRSNIFEMLHFVYKAYRSRKIFLQDFSPSIILSFFAIPSGILAYLLKRKMGIPYIISLRGGDVPGFLSKDLGLYHFFSSPITRLVWKNADVIVANSIGLKDLAENTATRYSKRVLYIPNGVDTELFSPGDKISGGPIEILFVGRLIQQKGVSVLLRALSELLVASTRLKQKVICQIVGDGPLRTDLEQQRNSLGLKESVHFLGWISRKELPAIYKRADIFVLPSSDEGMPNVILEAMAAGLAIIGTNIRGTNELVKHGETGIIINTPEELAPAILSLVNDPIARVQLARNARNDSLHRSWQEVATQYITAAKNIQTNE